MGNSRQIYIRDYARVAFRFALKGCTDDELAEVFDVSVRTIESWKRIHSEFNRALIQGKDAADAKVAKSMYKCARGYYIVEEEAKIINGKVVKVKVRKYVKPDVQAQIKWLSTRQRRRWTDTQKVEILQTNINILKLDLAGLTFEEKLLVEKLQLQQLAENAGNSIN